MVRLLHTSDWHLGRSLYGKSLLEDQEYILNRLSELLAEKAPHALLIAGDVFDRPFPPEAAVRLFDRFLSRTIMDQEIPVILIPGNHDSCERLGFASQLLRDQGLTIFARPEDAFHPIRIKGDNGTEALIHGIPFVEPPLIGRLLGRDDIRTPDEATGALCRAMIERAPSDHLRVLLCHAFVVGAETSESEKDLFIGGSSHVDVRAFEGFDYTALGHLHKPQRAGRDNVRYSGSLLPYSKSEVGTPKHITEIRLQGQSKDQSKDQSASFELEFHELKRLRDLRTIEGPIDELIRNAQDDRRRDDYVIAGYTDSGPVLDAFAKLRAVYSNLLHVSRAGGFLPKELPATVRQAIERESISELDLFGEFFKDTTGDDLNSMERDALGRAVESLRAFDADQGFKGVLE